MSGTEPDSCDVQSIVAKDTKCMWLSWFQLAICLDQEKLDFEYESIFGTAGDLDACFLARAC